MPFGSCGIGVWGVSGDLDLLCIASSITTHEQFFKEVPSLLSQHKEISELRVSKFVTSSEWIDSTIYLW